jgi:hypothetical protein
MSENQPVRQNEYNTMMLMAAQETLGVYLAPSGNMKA